MGQEGLREGESLAALAERALLRPSSGPALLFEGRALTGTDLLDSAVRLAAGLAALDVRRGDRVVVVMTNRPEVVVAYLAVWWAGGAVTPLIAAATADELRAVLVDSQARALVVSADRLALATAASTDLPVRLVVADDEHVPPNHVPGALRLTDLLRSDPLDRQPRSGDDLAALLYTGGTTGRAKGVMLGDRGLVAQSRARAEVVASSGTTGVLVPLPLSHVFGLVTTVTRLHLADPGTLVLQRRFAAAEWLALVAEHRVQSGGLVPSMLQLLLHEPLEQHDLSSLRYLSVGGAPLAVPVAEEFEARVPGALVCDGYGCTEVSSTATMNPPTARRLGSVGRPLRGTELRIVDDGGTPVPAGADGEVCVRAPGVMLGYWRDGARDPDATAEAVVDGWLRTGDIGHLDDDGYLYVVDRRKDLVIRGGFNVYPRDVEDVLLAHPAVAAAGVVGRPDPVLGEEVVAFVQLRSGAGAGTRTAGTDADAPTGGIEQELLAHCAARLAATKRPRELHLVEDLPVTSVGKTDRKALRARLAPAPGSSGTGTGRA